MRGVCDCAGHAVWVGSEWPSKPGYFTLGRRGPSPGFCGACGGFIGAGDKVSQANHDNILLSYNRRMNKNREKYAT
jgi:hypothetical protein